MHIDLHNHTVLCNHADGSVEEYIQAAISKGVDVFGFADHAPMNFDPKYRMGFDDMKAYEKEVLYYKEKYHENIEVLLGYEVDFIEGLVDTRVVEAKVDYLIGSIHFINEWGFDNPEFIGQYEKEDINEIWQKYFSLIAKMAKTKQFQIVGHLDLIKVFKFLPTKDILDIAKPALHAIKEAGMVLEINAAGYRKPIKEAYPSKQLLSYAKALGIGICFSSDAHTSTQIALNYERAVAFAKEVGYTECVFFRDKKPVVTKF